MKIPLISLALSTLASATVTIDYVTVGNPGNAADTTGYGAVSYTYNIGKYEVTNAQYAEFLNAVDPNGANPNGIYNPSMGSDDRGGITFNAGAAAGSKYTIRPNMGDKPVNYVSWYDAARFTNWLNNGQGSVDAETGAYTLNGDTGLPTRNSGPGVTVWLPSENEWYKAAYYDPTPGAGGGDNYWKYATQSDSPPVVATADASGDISNPGGNVANYSNGAGWNGSIGNLTTVGSAFASNFYDTADQNGNVWEWNDAIIDSSRGMRGGTWSFGANFLAADRGRITASPEDGNEYQGFRVAAIPEPSSLALAFLSISGLITRRRR